MQLSEVSSGESGSSDTGSSENGSFELPVKVGSARKARSPTRNTTPCRTNQRRSISWSAPRLPPSAGKRNRSATRMKSPKKNQMQDVRVELQPLTPKLIVTEDDEVLQVNGPAAITKVLQLLTFHY